MKKCILVNCFASSNEMRVEPIREVMEEQGYETIYVSSDFHHVLKQYVELDKSITPIHVRSYKKNLSINRLLAHREFAKKTFEFLCEETPELIYIKFPPNTLVKAAFDYKKKHDCTIILDLFDLWPEALPVPELVKRRIKPLLNIWARYRDQYISCADLVLTECDMYQTVLGDKLPPNTNTLYLTKRDIEYEFHPTEEGKIRLLYLGGINHLIDIDAIKDVIKCFIERGYELSLDVIGDGAKKDELIEAARSNGCSVKWHGIIFDEYEKYRIMSRCDFGLNLVKNSVKIALSIKSIEYFRAGLAIINNVQFDTFEIIEQNNAGINFMGDNLEFDNDINEMKRNSRNVYDSFFSVKQNKEMFRNLLLKYTLV